MIEIAIDLGGSFTRIYEKTTGLILEEPSLIAVEQFEDDYDILAMGHDAKKLQGKVQENIIVFSPIQEGLVKSVEYAGTMLREFLLKNFTKRQIKDISAYLLIPCGVSSEERENYRSACYMAGIKKVELLPKIICSAYNMGLDISGETSSFVVSIGGCITDVSAISNYSIIKGASTVIGGNLVDKNIVNSLYNDGLIIGLPTAKKLKEEIATLNEGQNLRYDIVGLDAQTKTPRTMVVSTNTIRKEIEPVLQEVIKIIQTTANICPPEVASDIVKYGIFVCGGTSHIEELERYLRKHLGVAVTISDDYGRSAILGAGKLLEDKTSLLKIIHNF